MDSDVPGIILLVELVHFPRACPSRILTMPKPQIEVGPKGRTVHAVLSLSHIRAIPVSYLASFGTPAFPILPQVSYSPSDAANLSQVPPDGQVGTGCCEGPFSLLCVATNSDLTQRRLSFVLPLRS